MFPERSGSSVRHSIFSALQILTLLSYGRIVRRILDVQSTQQADARQLLGLLACTKRPLRWHEIQGAVSIDLDLKSCDFNENSFRVGAKELCGSIVEIRSDGTVELVHITAKQ